MRDDTVVVEHGAEAAQHLFGGLDLIDGLHLERQVMQTRPVGGEQARALLPQRYDHPVVPAKERSAAVVLLSVRHHFEVEDGAVEHERALKIGDVHSDVAGLQGLRPRHVNHMPSLIVTSRPHNH